MSGLKLYTSPQCPFGRRAMITMLEKGLVCEYVWIPLSGQLKKMAEDPSGFKATIDKQWPGKSLKDLELIKEDYKKNVNTSGEVPTLMVGEDIIAEADVVAEFLEDAFPASGCSLMPRDAVQRSKVRHFIKILGGGYGVQAMYGCLMNQDASKDVERRDKVYKGLSEFARLASDDGPYFLGSTFSLADVMLMPMYDQFQHVLPAYRGVEFIPTDSLAYPWAPRLRQWAAAVERRESFTSLTQGKETYIQAYKGYAGERGVATFVRS